MINSNDKRKESSVVTLGRETGFQGLLKFNETVRVRGKFNGTIEAAGTLIVDKDAEVNADYINVNSLTVYGTVTGNVHALDKVDMMTGAAVKGDVTAVRIRIADGVLFEGQCSMSNVDKEVEIFSRPSEEIKAELIRTGKEQRPVDAPRSSAAKTGA